MAKRRPGVARICQELSPPPVKRRPRRKLQQVFTPEVLPCLSPPHSLARSLSISLWASPLFCGTPSRRERWKEGEMEDRRGEERGMEKMNRRRRRRRVSL
ncbi:hypothetical protein MHYP_G00255040 [Metynnis hypsauchen]